MSRLANALSFVIGLVRDPISKDLSSARLCGVACCIAGIYVGVRYPTTGALVVSALIAGGGVSLLTRAKADGEK